MKKTYITDLIGDKYQDWQDKKIILNGGTGCGKTYFVINTLIPFYLNQHKTVLYLCNRAELYKQLRQKLEKMDVTLMTYQALQYKIRNGFKEKYDLIIADECHYFYSDAKFNSYTDLSYDYVVNQQFGTVVFISATAGSLYLDLVKDGIVSTEDMYIVFKDYDYVEKVFTYKKDQLTDIIDYILEGDFEEKILVFVNSIERLTEMYHYYGETADYSCSVSQRCKFARPDCLTNNKLRKRILFTTKALDNGADIKDDDLKHIICELFDIDSILQAIGRKRPIDCFDSCNFYFRVYDARAINNFYQNNEKQLSFVENLLEDTDGFLNLLDSENEDTRETARRNKILYTDMRTKKIRINKCALKKYRNDKEIIRQMQKCGFEEILFQRLGEELKSKKRELDISLRQVDIFGEVLKEIEGQKLFKSEQEELKERFRDILGFHVRSMGINAMNGELIDRHYNYHIISLRENSRKSDNYKKRYWLVEALPPGAGHTI